MQIVIFLVIVILSLSLSTGSQVRSRTSAHLLKTDSSSSKSIFHWWPFSTEQEHTSWTPDKTDTSTSKFFQEYNSLMAIFITTLSTGSQLRSCSAHPLSVRQDKLGTSPQHYQRGKTKCPSSKIFKMVRWKLNLFPRSDTESSRFKGG